MMRLLKQSDPALNAVDSVSDRSIAARMQYEDLVRTSTLYNMLGDLYYQAKDMPKRLSGHMRTLFPSCPTMPLVLNNYAYFLAEEGGDIEKAYGMGKRAVEIDPENPTFLDTYAWILFKKGISRMR